MKLALGTVQFGLNYGVSNSQGQVEINEVNNILQLAHSLGIDTLDSASAYGDSEQVLGQLEISKRFKVITKIPKLSPEITSILPFIDNSLINLNRSSIDALFFHDADDLITHPNHKHFYQELISLKQQNIINKTGASLYHIEQWDKLKNTSPLDVLQVPVNCLDQRFIDHTRLSEFKKNKTALHCRSLFLQGLLLMNKEQWPCYFSSYKQHLLAFAELAKRYQCSMLSLALAIVVQKSLTNSLVSEVIEKLVIGCCSTQQLQEIISAYEIAQTLSINPDELEALASNDLGLINPSLWEIS